MNRTQLRLHLALTLLLRGRLPLGRVIEVHSRGYKAAVIERRDLLVAPYVRGGK